MCGFLYQKVACQLEQLIENEVLKIGDKLPSVRMLSQEHGISLMTAYKVYTVLEGKGLIEAYPKSGYYVKNGPTRCPDICESSTPLRAPGEVSICEMIREVYRDLNAPQVLNFAVSAPDKALLPQAKLKNAMLHALRNHPSKGLDYEDVNGNEQLREQLARLSFNWGRVFRAQDVVITSGCMEALVLSLKSVTQPGDTIAIEHPTYFGVIQTIKNLGLKVIELPTDPKNGPDINRLKELMEQGEIQTALLVSNFNNPLGSVIPDVDKATIAEMAAKYEIPIIEDDIYGDLYFDAHRPRTIKSYDREDWVLYCSSLSKSVAPGYRVGWTIPGSRFIGKVTQQKMLHSISTNSLAQYALQHFLHYGRYELHLRRLRRALHGNMLKTLNALREYFPEGTRASRPRGGFVLWLQLPGRVDAFQLHRRALQENIGIAPGQIFTARGNFSNYIRLSYGKVWGGEVETALRRLGQMAQEEMLLWNLE